MVEDPQCFAASGTAEVGRIPGIMKSENFQEILERNALPSVGKLGLSQRSQQGPEVYIQKYTRMVEKVQLDCFKMTSDESRPQSHRKSSW